MTQRCQGAKSFATDLSAHTGSRLLQALVVGVAALSYWSRLALLAPFTLAGAALAFLFRRGLPALWAIHRELAAVHPVLFARLTRGAAMRPHGCPACLARALLEC
ncbi:MAG: hypothetical protein NZU74_18135 [Chloroflexaceae bacterium]|nr:hypothetical protein [Chloroflexaceae bacterium]